MTTYTEAHLCGRGGLLHRWDLIPVEYVPQTTVWDWVNILNERCGRCGKVKAKLYDVVGDWKNFYRHNTGVQYGPTDVRPTPEDMRNMLLFRSERLTERAEAQQRRKDRTSKALRSVA